MASVVSASALQQFHARLATPKTVCATSTSTSTSSSGGGFSAREPSGVRMPSNPSVSGQGQRARGSCTAAASAVAEAAPVFAAPRGRPATLYDVLGISDVMVTDVEIKAAFRRIAKEVHPDQAPPDRVPEYQKKFMEAHKAYSVLKDPRTRMLYNFEMRNAAFSTPVLRAEDWRRTPTPASFGPSYWRGCNWETDQCW